MYPVCAAGAVSTVFRQRERMMTATIHSMIVSDAVTVACCRRSAFFVLRSPPPPSPYRFSGGCLRHGSAAAPDYGQSYGPDSLQLSTPALCIAEPKAAPAIGMARLGTREGVNGSLTTAIYSTRRLAMNGPLCRGFYNL